MYSLKLWLLFISLLPILILFGLDIGIPIAISNILVAIILIYPFVKYSLVHKNFISFKNGIFIYVVSIALIIFNVLYSFEPLNSLAYWLVYVLFIYGFNSWIIELKKKNKFFEFLAVLQDKLGVFLFFSLIIIYFCLTILKFGNGKTFNSFGIISGSAIVYFWFKDFKNIKYKIIILSILAFFLVISFSRSSLIFGFLSIFLTELLLIKKNAKRKLFLMIFSFTLLIFFSLEFSAWFAEKDLSKGISFNNISDLKDLNTDRFNLIENFANTYQNNFFTGYGINTTYQNLNEWNVVDNIGVHNGILEMILMVGVPLSLIFISFFFKTFKRIIKLAILDKRHSTFLGFAVYCVFRSYGESYFILNIGNVMSVFFLIILMAVYNTKSPHER